MTALALSSFFFKGLAVVVAGFVLFVGSVYLLLSAVFGLRMAYLVLAVSLFGWLTIHSLIWTFGPSFLGTPQNLGPRGYEPHWRVFAAGSGPVQSDFPETRQFPERPWKLPTAAQKSEVDTVQSVVQQYVAEAAREQLEKQGTRICEEAVAGAEAAPAAGTAGCLELAPESFTVTGTRFATSGDTPLVGSRAFYSLGGIELNVFARFDRGNVPKYSYAFLGASIFGFLVHLPFLDRAERRRKEILTGGAAPPWYGPA